MSDYWYENQDRLNIGDVCELDDGTIIKLDRRVPGDGTRWYVATWSGKSFSYEDYTIEPGDIKKGPQW